MKIILTCFVALEISLPCHIYKFAGVNQFHAISILNVFLADFVEIFCFLHKIKYLMKECNNP